MRDKKSPPTGATLVADPVLVRLLRVAAEVAGLTGDFVALRAVARVPKLDSGRRIVDAEEGGRRTVGCLA